MSSSSNKVNIDTQTDKADLRQTSDKAVLNLEISLAFCYSTEYLCENTNAERDKTFFALSMYRNKSRERKKQLGLEHSLCMQTARKPKKNAFECITEIREEAQTSEVSEVRSNISAQILANLMQNSKKLYSTQYRY